MSEQHNMECDPKILAEFRASKRGKDIKCFEDLPSGTKRFKGIKSFGRPRDMQTDTERRYLGKGEGEWYNIIGKPGDADYNGICTEAWRAERGR